MSLRTRLHALVERLFPAVGAAYGLEDVYRFTDDVRDLRIQHLEADRDTCVARGIALEDVLQEVLSAWAPEYEGEEEIYNRALDVIGREWGEWEGHDGQRWTFVCHGDREFRSREQAEARCLVCRQIWCRPTSADPLKDKARRRPASEVKVERDFEEKWGPKAWPENNKGAGFPIKHVGGRYRTRAGHEWIVVRIVPARESRSSTGPTIVYAANGITCNVERFRPDGTHESNEKDRELVELVAGAT